MSFLSYNEGMELSVTHDRKAETIEEKARWFQSLSLEERMDLLCAYSDMILEINPKVAEKKDAQSVTGRILILRQPQD